MGASTEATVLEALEQAEMAARERRLAASGEADAIVAAARQRAAAIAAEAGRRTDDALDELRRAAEAEADAAVANLERMAAVQADARTTDRQADPRVEGAVSIVVAHVLGEVTADGNEQERR